MYKKSISTTPDNVRPFVKGGGFDVEKFLGGFLLIVFNKTYRLWER
jgi:hypothetical protein